MFAALEKLDTAYQLDAQSNDNLLLGAMVDVAAANDDFVALENLSSAIDDLNHLYLSVEQFGYTKSLISFADHGKYLSRAIPNCIALEYLSSDMAADSATATKALEGIGQTIKETVGRWATAAWGAVERGFAAASTAVSGWVKKLGELASNLRGKKVDGEALANVEGDAPSASKLEAIMAWLRKLPASLKALWEKATGGDVEGVKADGAKIVSEGATEGHGIDPEQHSKDQAAGMKSDERKAKFGAAKEKFKGYTQDLLNSVTGFISDFVTKTLPGMFSSLLTTIRGVFTKAKDEGGAEPATAGFVAMEAYYQAAEAHGIDPEQYSKDQAAGMKRDERKAKFGAAKESCRAAINAALKATWEAIKKAFRGLKETWKGLEVFKKITGVFKKGEGEGAPAAAAA